MIDIKKLKQLVALMADNDLTEIDLEDEGEKIRLKRGSGGQVQVVPQPQPVAPDPAAANPTAAPAPAAEAAPTEPDGPTIDSPMVGTFYVSPSPDADAFVAVGSKVTPDTVVCIVEAMKVFNEIKAETSGTIEEILVENGSAVEFGQPLFRIKPS